MATAAEKKKELENGHKKDVEDQLRTYIARLESRVVYLEKTHSGLKQQLTGMLGVITAGDSPPRNEG